MLLDVDRFKEVNDTLGHDRGDALLNQVAERLADVLRDTDTVARLGGDEFAILLPNVGSIADAERLAVGFTACSTSRSSWATRACTSTRASASPCCPTTPTTSPS